MSYQAVVVAHSPLKLKPKDAIHDNCIDYTSGVNKTRKFKTGNYESISKHKSFVGNAMFLIKQQKYLSLKK